MPILLAAAAVSLICSGSGDASRLSGSSTIVTDQNGNAVTARSQSQTTQGFEDQVDVVIDGSASRIRLPRVMLPTVRGGKNGWFRLTDLVVTDTDYTASAKVNLINHPKIRLDRRTGAISIDGKSGHYAGVCNKAPDNQPSRF